MRRYTAAEDQAIRIWWGLRTPAGIGAELGRTAEAIQSRAYRLHLGPQLGASMSINGTARHLGWSHPVVRRAIAGLGLALPRVGMAHAVSPAQVEAIGAWITAHCRMPAGFGVGCRHLRCVVCGRDDEEHGGRGMCVRCYAAERRSRAGDGPAWGVRECRGCGAEFAPVKRNGRPPAYCPACQEVRR